MSTSLSAVKRRARLRATQQGAIIFIVAMTLAVLASLGLYALQSASVEVKTSGYGRQAAQSHYLSEYGALAGTQAMAGTTGQLYLGMMKNPTQRDTGCLSLASVNVSASDLSKACRRMGAQELSAAWGTSLPAVESFQNNTAGSLGPYPLRGDFYVELTDPEPAGSMFGIDTRLGVCFQQFTVTAVGITAPDTVLLQQQGVTLTPSALYGSEGIELSRSRITAGPMREGCN